ncbi:DUF3089 domain-containing protein [Nocardia miyunensis]|uniref:DUF3089 domain-containing protein n=1 Tax=Nocardia miyunensis TaxID=282684 RepID=UPI000A675F9A|nr:DUF3089 domain-containing protein [Nocardia miyunensis]
MHRRRPVPVRGPGRLRRIGVAAALVVAGGWFGVPPATADATPTVWLCRPGQAGDPCGGGSGAPVDCFYVYPTVSLERTTNADLTIGPEERAVAADQVAPFDGRCDVWAPMYRQRTLLGPTGLPAPGAAASDIAYADVQDAWDDYLAHDNHGRGVVLIGHSQGAVMLRTLIRKRIEATPQQRLLLSAIIPGADVLVRSGAPNGGDFNSIPACTDSAQIGCVVAYSTYATAPPPDARFGVTPTEPDTIGPRDGRPYGPGYEVLCTDPAALGSGTDNGLHSIVAGRVVTGYRGHCTTAGPRVLMIEGGGNGVPPATVLPALPDSRWGLHNLDMNIPQQDLIDLVAAQTRSWLDRQRPAGR